MARMTDDDILAAAKAADIPLVKLASGFFRVDRVGVLATLSAPIVEGDPFVVREKWSRRWKTLGKWKRLPRAFKEIKEYVL